MIPWSKLLIVAVIVCPSLYGCGGGQPSAEQAEQEQQTFESEDYEAEMSGSTSKK